uniref:DUF4708 domain-containing protein n=1 Tax=Cuerna arida TaxID=1464854 RepID=A0A1B6G463_9HEMI
MLTRNQMICGNVLTMRLTYFGRLLAICLEQVKETQPQLYHRMMTDVTKLVCEVSIPRSTPSHMAAHIRRLKCAKQINPVKSFFATGECPKILHFVIPVKMGVKLSQQPQQLLPDVWQDYLVNISEESSVATDSNNRNSKVKCKSSSKSKKTNSKIIPDILKNCLSYENGKWYSKTNPRIADKTSTLKPTIASTKETTEGNLYKETSVLETSSSKIQKFSTSHKPNKVVSFAKPSAHNAVINKYRKKSVKKGHSDQKNHKLNGQLLAKKKKIIIDKSAPPKVKFVVKPANAYPFKIKAESKSDTVAKEKDSFYSVQQPFINEVAKKTEHIETTDVRKNGLLQTSVKKTKDVIQKKSILSAKNKTLNCNGYDEKEKLSGIKREEESIAFLSNFHLIPKGLVSSSGSASANQVHNHNSLDKVDANVEKQSVSDFARTCKYINGVKQLVCEDDLAKPVPSQSVPSTKLRLRSREVTHRLRPPSTVKLKETQDLTCKFNITKPKTKVPTSIRPMKD